METEYPIRPPPPKPLDALKLKYGGASPEYASRQSWVTVNHLLRVRRCKSYFWHKMEKETRFYGLMAKTGVLYSPNLCSIHSRSSGTTRVFTRILPRLFLLCNHTATLVQQR